MLTKGWGRGLVASDQPTRRGCRSFLYDGIAELSKWSWKCCRAPTIAVKKRRKKSETETHPRGACSAPNAFWYKKAGRGGQIGRRYIRKAMLPTNIVWYEVHNIRYNQLPHNRNF